MIIELVGLPGAGKSTFARQLSSLGRYTKIDIKTTSELLWFNFCFVGYHPVLFWKLFFLYLRFGLTRGLWYTKLTSVFLDYNAKYAKARRYPYALLDQGHLQVLMSLFDNQLPHKDIDSILRMLPKSDHYIFFDTATDVRKVRLQERGYVSREGISDAEREQWQQTAENHFVYIKNNVQNLAPATIEIITEESSYDERIQSYQDAQFMRYITFGRMPTQKAHGLQIAKMCEAFTQQNVHVSLVTPRRSNDIQKSVASYYNLQTPLQHYEVPVFDVIGKTKKMTSLHHYLHEFLFALSVFWMRIPQEIVVYTRTPIIAFVCGLKGNTVVVEQHDWPTRGSALHSFFLSSATSIPCNSEGTHEACLKHGLEQAFVAHNGFDASIRTEPIEKSQARDNLGLAHDDFIVMYIGSLGGWKGVDTLAQSAENFEASVKAVVIGGNDTELQKWKGKYPQVLFVGPRPYDEIGEHQKAADVLIVPNNPISEESRMYTSPIKIFAHMASNVPMLVSDLPAMRNILSDETAFFFTAGDTESLVTTLQYIKNNPTEAQKRAQNAYLQSSEYTWKNRARKIIGYLR